MHALIDRPPTLTAVRPRDIAEKFTRRQNGHRVADTWNQKALLCLAFINKPAGLLQNCAKPAVLVDKRRVGAVERLDRMWLGVFFQQLSTAPVRLAVKNRPALQYRSRESTDPPDVLRPVVPSARSFTLVTLKAGRRIVFCMRFIILSCYTRVFVGAVASAELKATIAKCRSRSLRRESPL